MNLRSPKVALATVILAAAVVAGASASSGATPSRAADAQNVAPSTPSLAVCVKYVKGEMITRGKLTAATNDPALPPWFVNNNPGNERGFESAVVYKLAAALGFKSSAVAWYNEPYELSETAGTKPFDFDINEITYNAKLTNTVTFSDSYFNINQSAVSLKSDSIVTHHTPTALKRFLYGGVTGTLGWWFIAHRIEPTRAPIRYPTITAAIAALTAKKVDAIIVDVPEGQYIASQQLTGGVQFAQFHTTSEHYSLLLQKGNPLVQCLNAAIKDLTNKKVFAQLSKKYLSVYNKIPVIKP